MNIIKKIINKFITAWNILAITIILFIIVNALLWLVIAARNAPSSTDQKVTPTLYTIDGKNDNKINKVSYDGTKAYLKTRMNPGWLVETGKWYDRYFNNLVANIDGGIDTQYAFTSVEGINLYRVIQECVNNGLKYAFMDKASNKEISVNIHQESANFKINIIDNGQGFDTAHPELGNGLSNMKKRVKDVNGNFSITSRKEDGTKVEFSIPKSA